MDPLEIACLVQELKLSNEANEDCINLSPNLVQVTHERVAKCLLWKIFAGRVVNREALKTQLPRILQANNDIEIEIMGDNLFIVNFSSQAERRNALLNGPWHFSQSLMIFKEVAGLQKPSEVRFEDYSTWVQCHNLPISCMAPSIIREIWEKIGRVDEIDLGETGSCLGMYARIRVTRPIDAPLRRCVSLSTGVHSDSALILLRYERLTDFCYACGRVSHTIRFCNDEEADKENLKYGSWLRAVRYLFLLPASVRSRCR
ncbi:hypothetical protein OROMI_006353 [Orobanche minor]